MVWHLVWVWVWFLLGMLSYWLKRAYFLVTGPNPIANSYKQFVQRCWVPLVVRGFLESLIFWVLFTPGIADRMLAYFGWTSYGWAVGLITQVAPVAAFFGHAMDSIADMAVSKIPFINTILPQMPGPVISKPTINQAVDQNAGGK
jgi:hypothetical protein